MSRHSHVGAVAGVAAVFLVASAAMAKDYCLTYTGFSVEAVGRGFKIPAKGKCKSWIGFTGGSVVTQNVPTSGTGCTSSDGTHVSLTFTGSNPEDGGNIFIDSVTLALPAQTGTVYETVINNATPVRTTYGMSGAPCTKVPIPASASALSRTAAPVGPGGVH